MSVNICRTCAAAERSSLAPAGRVPAASGAAADLISLTGIPLREVADLVERVYHHLRRHFVRYFHLPDLDGQDEMRHAVAALLIHRKPLHHTLRTHVHLGQ